MDWANQHGKTQFSSTVYFTLYLMQSLLKSNKFLFSENKDFFLTFTKKGKELEEQNQSKNNNQMRELKSTQF